MSLILKGLDIPKDDVYFIVICGDGSIAFRNGTGEYFFLDDAQAIQIPSPHGRLVDIDKVKDELRDQIPCCGLDMTYSNSNAFDTMDNAPTILDEEGETK